MNKEQVLNELTEGYNLETLSLNDALTIGKKFKDSSIYKKFITWKDLYNYLDLFNRFAIVSSEAYRIRVRDMEGRGYIVEPLSSDENGYVKLQTNKQQLSDLRSALNRQIRTTARWEEFEQELLNVMKTLPDISSPIKKVPYTPSNSEAVLLFGDLHLGVNCDNAKNRFNYEIATQRIERLANKVIYYCKLNKIKTLHFCNLGDMIHGIIHTNARIEVEFDVAEQVIKSSELVANLLSTLNKSIPNIVYRSVLDNHSRVTPNKEESVEAEQFSRIIDEIIQLRLRGSGIKFEDNTIDRGIGSFELSSGKNFIFVHGHQDSVKDINKTLLAIGSITRKSIDYFALGHYHNPNEKDVNGTLVFTNGSIVGPEQFAFGKRLLTPASQKLLIFSDDEYADVQDIEITLAKENKE